MELEQQPERRMSPDTLYNVSRASVIGLVRKAVLGVQGRGKVGRTWGGRREQPALIRRHGVKAIQDYLALVPHLFQVYFIQ